MWIALASLLPSRDRPLYSNATVTQTSLEGSCRTEPTDIPAPKMNTDAWPLGGGYSTLPCLVTRE